jgi:hypothetical protein
MSTATLEKQKTDAKLNQLEQLKKFTKVVADTGDFESIRDFKPQDATTNPSLVFACSRRNKCERLQLCNGTLLARSQTVGYQCARIRPRLQHTGDYKENE